MTTPTPLSRAALAVMIAATNGNTNVVNDPVCKQCIAAALRAAADQVVPYATRDIRREIPELYWWDKHDLVRSELLAIAAEIGGTAPWPPGNSTRPSPTT